MVTPAERTHADTPDETINATVLKIFLCGSLGCVTVASMKIVVPVAKHTLRQT
jgi:hypothetical protein